MANLTKPRDCTPFLGDKFNDVVKSGVQLYKGGLVLKDASGELIKATSGAAAGVCRGVVQETILGDGVKKAEVRTGMFMFHISGADAVTEADCEKVVYALDDQTIAKTSDTGARPPVGKLKMITADSKAVVGVGPLFSVDGDLVAANNLSDVAVAATALANLGGAAKSANLSDMANAATSRGNLGLANDATGRSNLGVRMVFTMVIDTLVGAGVTRLALPDMGGLPLTIVKLESSLQGALAVGNATLTFSINGTAITTGVLTITEAGSAAGDRDEAVPSALNVSDGADDELRCTLGGTNTAAVKAIVTITCTY